MTGEPRTADARDGDEWGRVPNVLLSIHPEHAEAILSGDKLYEYRRVPPARGPPMRLVLYATVPTKAVVGDAYVWEVMEDTPSAIADRTVGRTTSSRGEVLDYFEGVDTAYAIRIGTYRRFASPIPRGTLVDMDAEPAQNFRYIGEAPANGEAIDNGTIRYYDDTSDN
jgi:predicted transcriptional regulator